MDYGTAGTALTSGILFGYVLEQAGFASPCKLTAQFKLSDWSVFKVMFTAIVVASIGILLLQINDTFGSSGFFVPTITLGAMILGGALIGAGFALGGYCPGTSVVGAMSGRLDAIIFAVGMVLGVWVFSWLFDNSWMQSLLASGAVAAKTVPQLLGVSPWLVVAIMALLAFAGFRLGSRFEKSMQGVYDAKAISKAPESAT